MKSLNKALIFVSVAAASMAAYAISTAQLTRSNWILYNGSTMLSQHASEAGCIDAAKALNVSRTYSCRTATTVAVTYTPDTTPGCTTPKPPDETLEVSCPSGSVGSWTQTKTYTAAPYPTCWTAGNWTPSTAPSGACTTGSTTGNLFVANYGSDSIGASESTEGESGGFSRQGIVAPGVFELRQTPGANPRDYGGQYGWGHSINLPAWPSDTSRCLFFRMKMDASNNYAGRSWADGAAARSVNKFIHVGQAPGRWILNIEGTNSGSSTWGWSLQLDGGARKVERFGLQNGRWYEVKVELRYGSNAVARVWIDDMSTPWLQTSVFSQPPPANSGWLGVGFYNNNGLQPSGVFAYQHSGLRVSSNCN